MPTAPPADELLARNPGTEPDDWPLPEKLRLLAALFDAKDTLRGVTDRDVQRDLRIAADILGSQRITASPEDGDIDEIVARGVTLHVERMHDSQVWFAIGRPGTESELHFWFTAERRGELRTSAYWDGEPWPDVRHDIRRWNSEVDGE